MLSAHAIEAIHCLVSYQGEDMSKDLSNQTKVPKSLDLALAYGIKQMYSI